MVDELDEVLALKASAKTARDDGDWEGALSDLEEAVEILTGPTDASLGGGSSRVAAELADTFGMIGGIERRWGLSTAGAERQRHLERSVIAYDEGFGLERSLPHAEESTYNRVNRLIGRVLLDPNVLAAAGDPTADLSGDLRQAEEILTDQLLSARQKDPWGYSDLGIIRLLRGAPDAMSVFDDLEKLRPPAFVYESTLTTLEPLADIGSDLRPGLARAAEMVRRLARQ